MRRTAWIVLALPLMAATYSCGPERPEEEADLILTGGLIWAGPQAAADAGAEPTAIAIADGKILAVGTDEELELFATDSTVRLPLAGRRVVPGFIDSHTHFIDGGLELAGVQLRDAATPDEFARRIGAFAAEHPGEWVTGGQWDHELWGGELPRRDWIDSLTAETPVFVSRLDGHMSLANTRALELARVTASTPDPPGGTIVRYEDGRPTGVLKDAAAGLVTRVMPLLSNEARERALQAASEHALARGVTLITDMSSMQNLFAYKRAQVNGTLRIRVYSVVPLASWRSLLEFRLGTGPGDHRLFWGGLKAFVDGSLGSTTAWFYEPYNDDPSTSGLMVTDTAELRRQLVAADSVGLHVMIHAIGDRANDWLLGAFADAAARNGARDRRFRIEHAQHLTREAISRFGADGVIASMQPYHAIDDGRWAEKRIGAERIKTTYSFRSLIDAGARLAFGSDWTVAPIDPLQGIYAAVTRRTIDGANPGGWVAGEKIEVAEAMTAYTASAAYACFMDDVLGTLEPGKYADLVVLSGDIFTIDPVEIKDVKVDVTMIEGEVVYRREG